MGHISMYGSVHVPGIVPLSNDVLLFLHLPSTFPENVGEATIRVYMSIHVCLRNSSFGGRSRYFFLSHNLFFSSANMPVDDI